MAIARLVAGICGLLVLLMAAETSAAGSWQVVLAAGDDAQPVFDNATRAFERLLLDEGVPSPNIHRLSAAPDAAEPASLTGLLRRIVELPARSGDRCLVFLTSHGMEGVGLWFARSRLALDPDALAEALAGGCRAAPTVVIVSGCYTGEFAEGEMRAANRIILTAARPDRPSFGCQADRTYNFYDECLLAALRRSATWRAVSGDADACVRRKELELRMRPSEPRNFFGVAVRDLPVR